MDYISNRSCIRFTPRTSYNKNYIYITKGSGCSSEVGMRHTGKQLMNINEDLCPRGKVIHELLHSLGFLHVSWAAELIRILTTLFAFLADAHSKVS